MTFPKLKDPLKVRWAVKDTSIVTAEKFDVPGTQYPVEGHHTVAHNVGKDVAHHVIRLHNSKLDHDWAVEKSREPLKS